MNASFQLFQTYKIKMLPLTVIKLQNSQDEGFSYSEKNYNL